METTKATQSDRAVLRGEMGTSPDEPRNETINNWLDSPAPAGGTDATPAVTADSVIELLPRLDDDSLVDLKGQVLREATARSPEGRGAMAFRKAFRKARRERRANADAATALLEEAEGAVIAFFQFRGAAVTVGEIAVLDTAAAVEASAELVIEDPELGMLRATVRGRYDATSRACDSASITLRSRWARRFIAGFGGGADGGAEVAIKEFAAWAALQPQP